MAELQGETMVDQCLLPVFRVLFDKFAGGIVNILELGEVAFPDVCILIASQQVRHCPEGSPIHISFARNALESSNLTSIECGPVVCEFNIPDVFRPVFVLPVKECEVV